MIDVHCHIIPAIDDGPQSDAESLELLRSEVSGGTKAFIATPHVYTEQDLRKSAQIPERLARLRELAAAEGIEAEFIAGAEVYPFPGIAAGLDDKLPITVAGMGKYLLLDLPMTALPMDFDQIIFEIQARGVTPIIAHPERCRAFQMDRNRLREILDRGALCQVNAGSLRGKYGPDAAASGRYFIAQRWASFLASDVHKARPRPSLRAGLTFLEEDGEDAAFLRYLTEETGRAVIEGRPLPPPPARVEGDRGPKKEKSQGFLSRLFGRG